MAIIRRADADLRVPLHGVPPEGDGAHAARERGGRPRAASTAGAATLTRLMSRFAHGPLGGRPPRRPHRATPSLGGVDETTRRAWRAGCGRWATSSARTPATTSTRWSTSSSRRRRRRRRRRPTTGRRALAVPRSPPGQASVAAPRRGSPGLGRRPREHLRRRRRRRRGRRVVDDLNPAAELLTGVVGVAGDRPRRRARRSPARRNAWLVDAGRGDARGRPSRIAAPRSTLRRAGPRRRRERRLRAHPRRRPAALRGAVLVLHDLTLQHTIEAPTRHADRLDGPRRRRRRASRTRSATRSAASRAPRSSCAARLADPEHRALHRPHRPRGRAARRPRRAAARARHAAAAAAASRSTSTAC